MYEGVSMMSRMYHVCAGVPSSSTTLMMCLYKKYCAGVYSKFARHSDPCWGAIHIAFKATGIKQNGRVALTLIVPFWACGMHCVEICVTTGRTQVVECKVSASICGWWNGKMIEDIFSWFTVKMSCSRKWSTAKGRKRRCEVACHVAPRVAYLCTASALRPGFTCRRLAEDWCKKGISLAKWVKCKAVAHVMWTTLEGEHVAVRILGRRQSCERCQKKDQHVLKAHGTRYP